MYYPDQPFHIRTYKKSELAHLYNPNVCLKVALQILRRWIVYNLPLLQELEQEGYRARNRLLPFRRFHITHFFMGSIEAHLSHNSVPLSFSEERHKEHDYIQNLSYNFFHLIQY